MHKLSINNNIKHLCKELVLCLLLLSITESKCNLLNLLSNWSI